MRLLDSGFVRFWALAGLVRCTAAAAGAHQFLDRRGQPGLHRHLGALALNLLMGTTGQISLGHAGFIAAGAFTRRRW